MRDRQSWEEKNIGKRPLTFKGYPLIATCPSSFPWTSIDGLNPPTELGTGRLEYKNGWSAVIFWNREIFFVDEILTFDAIIELIQSRFPEVENVKRAYDEDLELGQSSNNERRRK